MNQPTNAQVLTVLKHLANGRQPDFAAQVTNLTQSVVERIAEDAGWPDPDAVRKAIFNLTWTELTSPAPAARPAAPVASPRPDLSVAQAPRVAESAQVKADDGTAVLLRQASESAHARTRNLGTKISGLLADLTQRLDDEAAERRQRQEAEREKAKNAQRIAELEAELARLKGKGPKATKPAGEKRTNTLPKGEYPCDHCDRVLDTPQGKAAHQRRAHEGFNPHAAHNAA